MKVLLTSHGSTGDIYPVVALGVALLQAGHEVRFAAPSLFQDNIERAGITFIRVPPDWEQKEFAACMQELDQTPNPLFQLKKIYENAIPHLQETIEILSKHTKEVDLVVGSYLFPGFHGIAKKYNTPFAVITFAHNVVPTSQSTPDQWPRLSFLPATLQKKWTSFVWKCSDLIVDTTLNYTLRSFIKKGVISKTKYFFTNPAPLALVAVSPSLMMQEKPKDSPFQYTGYLRWQSMEDEALEKRIKMFCEGKKVPILNFGSVAFKNADQLMLRFEKNWPAHKKIIIQSGWAKLSPSQDYPNILVIGKVSHDQLFAHASCVIHHGGAGTTASVLHAGCPQIIVPHIADQSFFAAEIERLEVGTSVSKSNWPEELPSLVRQVESNDQMKEKSKEVASILSSEDGPTNAVQALSDYQKTFLTSAT